MSEQDREVPDRAPGDQGDPDEASVGENICDKCGGSGKRDGETCAECGGTGKIQEVVGGP